MELEAAVVEAKRIIDEAKSEAQQIEMRHWSAPSQQGFLNKKDPAGVNWTRRYFMLRGPILLYFVRAPTHLQGVVSFRFLNNV